MEEAEEALDEDVGWRRACLAQHRPDVLGRPHEPSSMASTSPKKSKRPASALGEVAGPMGAEWLARQERGLGGAR